MDNQYHERLETVKTLMEGCGCQPEILPSGESEILVFTAESIATAYEGMEPAVSVAFQSIFPEGSADILHICIPIGMEIPLERLSQMQLFCGDVNKVIQLGYFAVNFSDKNCCYQYSQPVQKDVTQEELTGQLDIILSQIIVYLVLVYDILLDMSFGKLGYEETAEAVEQRNQRIHSSVESIGKIGKTSD